MKYKLYCFGLLILFFAFAQESIAQDQPRPRTTRQRPSETGVSAVPDLTERARIKNESNSQKPSHIAWERGIFRVINLTKEENNAALYYPVQPQGNRQNLFTLVFKLLADGKITAYDYALSEGESFEENQKKDFEEFLKQLQILYTKQGEQFKIDERDIPGADVTEYMIKEGYYFDQATGTFQNTVLAICPILVREDYYYGNNTREALFWLKYDDIRPYLSREMIMTSNYNNILTHSMDDFFQKNMYTGEIVKTVNMMGKSLAQEVGNDPDALKQAQDSIESQLKTFNNKLWVYNDSTALLSNTANEKKTTKEGNSSSSRRNSSSSEKKSAKAQQPKAPKAEKASPSRSVRRSR